MEQYIFFALLALFPTTTWGYIDSDGACSLSVFVPFTVDGKDTGSMMMMSSVALTNQGFSHMAGALMAMEHFNSRNTSVVPELGDLISSSSADDDDCNVRFDMNTSIFYDTGSVTHLAARSLVQQEQKKVPCAIVGPYNDLPARDLSILALAYKIPHVAYRVFDPLVVSSFYSPYSLSVFPGILDSSRMLVDFLVQKGRTDFVAIFYSWTPRGVFRREALTIALSGYGMRWTNVPFLNDEGSYKGPVNDLDVRSALGQVKKSGFRTIILSMDNVHFDMQSIADAAEEFEMNKGDYFFVVQDLFEPTVLHSNNSNITKLLSGSATVLPYSKAGLIEATDPFVMAWKSQGKQEVDRLNAANPIKEGQPGYAHAKNDYFQSVPVEYGAFWIYDAVMSLGIGACQAVKQRNGTINSSSHYKSVSNTRFTGATGEVAFGGMSYLKDDGSRLSSTLSWVAANLIPPKPQEETGNEFAPFTYTDMIEAGTRVGSKPWAKIDTFYFRDGRTVSPELLRDTPEQNYLSKGLRITGFVLMGIVWLSAIVTVVWVFLRREHNVIRASQPVFLYILAVGAFIQSSAILPMSFDESYGWTKEQLGRACVAITWLIPLGHIITYAALFTKLWRVNKVLQFSRRKVEVKHVAGPMLALVIAALLILSLWTAIDPLQWSRVEINEETGESFGQCTEKTSSRAFLVPLMFVVIIPTILTLFMAWKTKDVDEAYSESKWIFSLVLLQLEVILFAVPITIILRGVSTDGKYLGMVIIVWSLPMSTLGLIMIPKYLAYCRIEYPTTNDRAKLKRGQSAGIQVTGLTDATAAPSKNQLSYSSATRIVCIVLPSL